MVKLIKKLLMSEFGLKLQEKFFPNNYTDPDNTSLIIKAMERFRNCDNKKNASQIKREIQVCKKYWKCSPHHYFTNNLYRADNEVTDKELINYIPQFYWFNVFLPHYSSPRFYTIGENKIR
jgi:muconolactone delta-isomerase